MAVKKIQFLITLGSAIRNGAVKTIKQAIAFAEQQFGKIDKSFVDDIVNVFKKEGKTKKGDVVPIKKKEGIMSQYKSIDDDLTQAEKDAIFDNFLAHADRTYANFVTRVLRDIQKAPKSERQQMIKAIKDRTGMFRYLDDADAEKILKSVDEGFIPIKKKPLSEAEKDIADIQKSIDDLDAAEAAADASSADVVKKKAAEDAKKLTDDIVEAEFFDEITQGPRPSKLMKDVEKKVKDIKKQADELKKVADDTKPFMEIAEGPQKGKKITIDDFFAMTGAARDPRQGVVRAAAREILNKNKVKIGREDPIDVLRQMYGEKGLEAIDAVSDSLLDVQSYGEMNTILRDNKLFDLVPKKTYGYDQSVVTAEKIRKAKEQEAKNLEILEDFKPDREPSAYGGIIGNLRLNRTGYGLGSGPKGFKLAKEIIQSKKYKDFIEMLFIKASNMIRQGKGIFKNLDESQRIKQHDNLTNEVTNFQKTGELPESVHQYFGMNPEVAYAEAMQKVSTVEKSREKVRNFKKLQAWDPGKGRKSNADGGLIDILKL